MPLGLPRPVLLAFAADPELGIRDGALLQMIKDAVDNGVCPLQLPELGMGEERTLMVNGAGDFDPDFFLLPSQQALSDKLLAINRGHERIASLHGNTSAWSGLPSSKKEYAMRPLPTVAPTAPALSADDVRGMLSEEEIGWLVGLVQSQQHVNLGDSSQAFRVGNILRSCSHRTRLL